jgi:PqqD family protein of HPr-rel-A system
MPWPSSRPTWKTILLPDKQSQVYGIIGQPIGNHRVVAWRLNELASLHWRCWDNEWAVFDVGSGQTHHMDTLTAVTLLTVEAGAIDSFELQARVAEELLLPNDLELSTAVSGVLDRLVTAGLIESNGT